MRLTTRIHDFENKVVNYTVTHSVGDRDKRWSHIHIQGKEVGWMEYSLIENCLYIHRMYNYSTSAAEKFQHVGSLLLEIAVRISQREGKEGRVELDAIDASPAAYFNMGFRKKNTGAVFLDGLIQKYRLTKDEKIKVEILASDFYKYLQEAAAEFLSKPVSEISFEEAITYGSYDPLNNKFAQALAEAKAEGRQMTAVDCYKCYMNGTMYLPPEANRRILTQPFIPIGSNYFFSLPRVKHPKLIGLVKEGKLDSSNAVEMEYYLTINDPRWSTLLSDNGLEAMKNNYISAWYVAIYFSDPKDVEAIFSKNGLKAFHEGYIRDMDQLINLRGLLPSLLSDKGLQALRAGDLIISSSGCVVKNKMGDGLDYRKLNQLFGSNPVSLSFTA